MERPFIGSVRRFLLMPFTCRWNGWVRETTARLERRGYLRSQA